MILKNGLLNDLFDILKSAIVAILFGSVARNDYDERSDIDVLLIYKNREVLNKDKELFDEIPLLKRDTSSRQNS